MRWIISFAAGTLLLVGCTFSHMYGARPTQLQTTQWGCNHASVTKAYEEDQAVLRKGYVRVPQVGWDMCEVLARVGYPGNLGWVGQVYRSEFGASVSFYYYLPGKGVAGIATEGTIDFEQEPGSRIWRVTSTIGF